MNIKATLLSYADEYDEYHNSLTEKIHEAIKHINQLEQERDQLREALELVTTELESWAATEEDPDSVRVIKLGKRVLMKQKKPKEG